MQHTVKAAGPWEYFVRKVRIGHPSQCWEWQGSVGSPGYGNWSYSGFGGKTVRTAHRATFALFNGREAEGQVNHRCGNRRCCNPGHLYEGTQKQNIADAQAHGTHSPPPHKQGEQVGNSVLSDNNAAEIKWLLANNGIGASIAQEYSVSPSTVSLISKGRLWVHVRPCRPPATRVARVRFRPQ